MSIHSNKILEKIVHCEKSAIETYTKVLAIFGDNPILDPLKNYSSDHIQASQYFLDATMRNNALENIIETGGLWGSSESFISSSPSSVSARGALQILKDGEEVGMKLCKEALESPDVAAAIKPAISTHFIPQQRRHIKGLKSLIEKLSYSKENLDQEKSA